MTLEDAMHQYVTDALPRLFMAEQSFSKKLFGDDLASIVYVLYYSFFTVGSLVSPWITLRLGERKTLCLGTTGYGAFTGLLLLYSLLHNTMGKTGNLHETTI